MYIVYSNNKHVLNKSKSMNIDKETNEKTKTWQKMNKVKWMQIKFEEGKT